MIRFDGDRSLKRKWFAKKKLEQIKEMDIPASAPIWDGFQFKVWQLGDIDGGSVKAPMGAVVLCSSPSGIKIAVADYWAGGFTSYTDYHMVYKDSPGDVVTLLSYNLVAEEDMVTAGVEIVKFRPEITASYIGLDDGETIGTETVLAQDYSPLPGIMPYKTAEGFWLSSSAKFYIDFNNNGTQDFPKVIADNTLTFYCSDGSNLSGRRTTTLQIGGRDVWAGAVQPQRIYQQLNADWQVMTQRVKYERDSVAMVRGWNMQFPAITPLYMADAIPDDPLVIPEALRDILLDNTEWNNMWPLGSYSFLHGTDQVFLQMSDVTNTIQWDGDTPAEQYFDTGGNEDWRLFFTMTVGAAAHIVNSGQFLNLLDTVQGGDILSGAAPDWRLARRMIEQFLPYPNNVWTVPYDAVMFHGHDGKIYTWTRTYGSVYFSTTGLYLATVNVPAEASTETGVRPDITYAGTFDTVPLYLCVCNKVKEEVKAVYYGSPFTYWTILPGVAEGQTLVHVRPVSVTPADIFLIGVVKETIEIETVPTTVYSFASLHWFLDGEGIASTALWQKQGRLPFAAGDFDNFQVGLFGEDQRVVDLINYLSPHPTLPQMPVGPYDKYAIGMP